MATGEGVLQPDGRKMMEPRMEADHVGNAVVYMASLPLDTNVLFMTVMANKMPFVGRGERMIPKKREPVFGPDHPQRKELNGSTPRVA
jgi:hypothetical protein